MQTIPPKQQTPKRWKVERRQTSENNEGEPRCHISTSQRPSMRAKPQLLSKPQTHTRKTAGPHMRNLIIYSSLLSLTVSGHASNTLLHTGTGWRGSLRDAISAHLKPLARDFLWGLCSGRLLVTFYQINSNIAIWFFTPKVIKPQINHVSCIKKKTFSFTFACSAFRSEATLGKWWLTSLFQVHKDTF